MTSRLLLVALTAFLAVTGGACPVGWASSPQVTAAEPSPAVVRSIRLESLLPRRDTRRIGEWQAGNRWPQAPVMEGQTVPHALVVGAFGRKPSDAAELRIRLDGAFDRFTVTVGRDDKETEAGPAYAVFEVWGDDKLLVRSLALRSGQHPVSITGVRSSARRAPQQLDTPVSGVRVLRLVTRSATELEQQVPADATVSGCLWVDPLLVPAIGAKPVGERASALPPPPDDVRTVLRGIVVQVAAQAVAAQTEASPPLVPPFSILFGPVTLAAGKSGSLPVSEPQLRTMVVQMMLGARRGSVPVFVPPPGRVREPKIKPDDETRWREAARTAKAFLLARILLTPPSSPDESKAEGRWQVEIRLVEAESGRQAGAARAFLTGGR